MIKDRGVRNMRMMPTVCRLQLGLSRCRHESERTVLTHNSVLKAFRVK